MTNAKVNRTDRATAILQTLTRQPKRLSLDRGHREYDSARQ